MGKKLILVVAAVLVLALAVPAFAATISDVKKKEINALNSQIAELRKKVVDEYVSAGVITSEQGKQIKSNIDKATKYQQENADEFTPGTGCGGGGYGMMNDGYGMMNGSYNSGNVSNQADSALGQAI